MRKLLTYLCAIALIGPGSARAAFFEELQFGTGLTIPIAWEDFNGDGHLDLTVGNYNQPDQLFVSDGAGGFNFHSTVGGNRSTFAVAWADFDNDGDPDLAVGSYSQNHLFINDGSGNLTETSEFGGDRSIAIAWGDCNNDGHLDLAVGNGILGPSQQNKLYLSDGDGGFIEHDEFGLLQTCSIAWGDCDGDGDLDLAVGNGGFNYIGQNGLYIGDGSGGFTYRAEFGIDDTACLAWSDSDNDGDLDLAVGNWNNGQNLLYVNDGSGNFTELPRFGALDCNTLAWGDANNDGLLDVAVGNGDFGSADNNFLYLNLGGNNFQETVEFGQGSTDGVAWADYDGDGDLDLASGNEHSPTQNYLYTNQAGAGVFLRITLEGLFHENGAGFSNRDGIGAKLFVYSAGQIGDPAHLLGYREIETHGGFSSQGERTAHFGLPGAAQVDLRIIWPGSAGSNLVQDLPGTATGSEILVREGLTPTSAPDQIAPTHGLHGCYPNPFNPGTRIDYTLGSDTPYSLDVMSVKGERVLRIAEGGDGKTGRHSAYWDGSNAEGSPQSSGLYFAVLRTDAGIRSTKMLLLK